jgi:hypothetical protein
VSHSLERVSSPSRALEDSQATSGLGGSTAPEVGCTRGRKIHLLIEAWPVETFKTCININRDTELTTSVVRVLACAKLDPRKSAGASRGNAALRQTSDFTTRRVALAPQANKKERLVGTLGGQSRVAKAILVGSVKLAVQRAPTFGGGDQGPTSFETNRAPPNSRPASPTMARNGTG